MFKVEGKPIYAHRCIIMCRSEPLQIMMNGPMRESYENIIEIKDCSYDVFLSFLEFLYTENVIKLNSFEVEHINELYSVADMYIVDQLKQHCIWALIKQIKMKNICKMLSESYKWGIFEVKLKCIDFTLKHFGCVIGMDEFVELP